MMGFGMGFGMFFVVLFWIVLIVGIVWLVGVMFQMGRTPDLTGRSGSTPREILDQRYARGELTREQYDLMKRDLS